ncbi:MAG: hypothetical protein NUV57_06095 [archaeon]|nr:hypothetical protein [archaeon]
MLDDLSFFRFNSDGASTKERIVLLLSDEWSLTAKEIYSKLEKLVKNPLSYQAVHKTLNQLITDRVISKKGRNYGLNKEWISNLKKFSENLEQKYELKNKNYSLNKNDEGQVKWVFDDTGVFCVEMAKLLGSDLGAGVKGGIGLMRHAWWPMSFKFLDFTSLAKMLTANPGGTYLIVQENTPLSRWITKQFKVFGMTGIKIGEASLKLENDLALKGDFIIETRFSEQMNKNMDEIYNKAENLEDLANLYKEYMNKTDTQTEQIEVTITKNSELSRFLQHQLLEKYFPEVENPFKK